MRQTKQIIIFLVSIFLSMTLFAAPLPETGFADLTEKLIPTVVNISTVTKVMRGKVGKLPFPDGSPFEEFNDFFERFGMPPGYEPDETGKKLVSLGSGFVIDPQGFIVTNFHVIADADEITITMNNDKKYKAKIIGTDNKTDIALLKIDSDKPLPFVKFGDSDEARVGDWVIAIGNPFGLGGTMTAGVISAKARDINAGPFDDFIQTDAAINKGNSGGPMFNLKGEVIGINTAIYSPSGGSVGIGFATPSSLAKNVVEQLKKGEKIRRSWLGVKIQPITDDIAENLGLKEDKGALIVDVTKTSPADKAGLKTGDIIQYYGNTEISSIRKLPRLVAETSPGSKVDLLILRKGEKKRLTVNLEQMLEDNVKAAQNNNEDLNPGSDDKLATQILGMGVVNLTSDVKDKNGLDKGLSGVLIAKIDPKSESFNKGIRKGDVISSVNQEPIKDVNELKKIVDKSIKDKKKNVLLFVTRGNQTLFLAIPLN